MADVVAALGVAPMPPLVGFVWRASLPEPQSKALAGFFRNVASSNEILGRSDAAWERLRPAMRVETEAEFARLRDYFRAGIPGPWGEPQTRAAERLFGILKDVGGASLVGERTRFDPALFGPAAA
jgi:NitT/TauT family transport system substrate-binding protein